MAENFPGRRKETHARTQNAVKHVKLWLHERDAAVDGNETHRWNAGANEEKAIVLFQESREVDDVRMLVVGSSRLPRGTQRFNSTFPELIKLSFRRRTGPPPRRNI